MGWYLKRVQDQWEIWNENAKEEMGSLKFLSSRTSVPSSFATLEELEKWLMAQETKQAKNHALKLLAARNYPAHILHRKLVMKGFSNSIAQDITNWAQQQGYVQDDEYLQTVIRHELERGHGPRSISWKLRMKGFSGELIERAIKKALPPSLQREAIQKTVAKLKLSTEYRARQKTILALLRRGFDMDLIQEIF